MINNRHCHHQNIKNSTYRDVQEEIFNKTARHTLHIIHSSIQTMCSKIKMTHTMKFIERDNTETCLFNADFEYNTTNFIIEYVQHKQNMHVFVFIVVVIYVLDFFFCSSDTSRLFKYMTFLVFLLLLDHLLQSLLLSSNNT